MTATTELLEPLFATDAAALRQGPKEALLLPILSALTARHWDDCPGYRRVLAAHGVHPPFRFDHLLDVPALPVRLFKQFDLRSVPEDEVVRVLRSSGTTGQQPSRVFLDDATSRLQAKALVRIFQPLLGRQRRPMLLVDSRATIADRKAFTARGAGLLGLSNLGRDHTYLLDSDMGLDLALLEDFVARHHGEPLLVFGFTFMIWQYLVQALRRAGRRLSLEGSILIHSGGWKKLQDQAVPRDAFRAGIEEVTGISAIHDFYGMVEQVGSVFVECHAGRLHAPTFAEVVIRDPRTWRMVEPGVTGVVQVLSVLPWSYPGHSLVTEDLGRWYGDDTCPCGRGGRVFEVLGRVPRAEVRGCSDTHVGAA